jgi:hypothetical protein
MSVMIVVRGLNSKISLHGDIFNLVVELNNEFSGIISKELCLRTTMESNVERRWNGVRVYYKGKKSLFFD